MAVGSKDSEGGRPSELQTIGKYKIVGTLGRGSMGVVYKGQDPEIGRIVAIKTLRKLTAAQFHDTDTALERFKIEARSAGNLRHPNVITVFDVNIDGDIPYIVMDYVEGESLDQIIAKHSRIEPRLALFYLKQVAAGVDAAHEQNVIHRDLKPSNIIVDKNEACYVVDFGVAQISESFSDDGEDSDEPIMGTPGYMSPEQILNKRLDPRSDLFSLAVVAFECFTGIRPFPGSNFTEVLGNILNAKPLSLSSIADLPLALEAEFERALSKNRDERFSSAQQMVDAFAIALGLQRIDKPTLSAVAGAERGPARERKPSEWKSLGSSTQTAAGSPGHGHQPHQVGPGVDNHAWTKRPSVPLDDVMPSAGRPGGQTASAAANYYSGAESAGTMGAGAVHYGSDQINRPPIPGDVFAHGDRSQPVSSARRGNRSILPLIIGIIAVLCIVAGGAALLLIRNSDTDVTTAVGTPPEQVVSAAEALDPAAPRQLRLPAVDPVPEGKMITEMTDREVLGVLMNSDVSEEMVLGALYEAERRSISELIEASVVPLRSDSYRVRIEAIKTLKRLKDKRSVPLLVQALDDHDPLVRGSAANALAAIGSRKALAYLSARYEKEEVEQVLALIERAIEKIRGYPLQKGERRKR